LKSATVMATWLKECTLTRTSAGPW
jgi:hypothetical protein